jgi:hypothetical protein
MIQKEFYKIESVFIFVEVCLEVVIEVIALNL